MKVKDVYGMLCDTDEMTCKEICAVLESKRDVVLGQMDMLAPVLEVLRRSRSGYEYSLKRECQAMLDYYKQLSDQHLNHLAPAIHYHISGIDPYNDRSEDEATRTRLVAALEKVKPVVDSGSKGLEASFKEWLGDEIIFSSEIVVS